MLKLAEFFNVNNVIVSQTNPWVIPFLNRSEHHKHRNTIFTTTLQIIEKIKVYFKMDNVSKI